MNASDKGRAQAPDHEGARAGAQEGVAREAVAAFLDGLLQPQRFSDYCPNGLQVEGSERIRTVVCGVTASLALVQAAADAGAQALLVHHGWFWRGEDPRVLGPRRQRLASLLANRINLFAYHLPLDVHPEVGNNSALARIMDWPQGESCGRDGLLRLAPLEIPLESAALAASLRTRLGREPLMVGELTRPIRRLAWCTGAAQDFLQDAIDAGADAFVSGEISERTTHLAREAGVVYVAAGHHATERFGVQALGQRLGEHFGIDVRFSDDPNPV
jgi:dinuclear metal center YbgI/SA1388 family protein